MAPEDVLPETLTRHGFYGFTEGLAAPYTLTRALAPLLSSC
jgi:hypothetical protein